MLGQAPSAYLLTVITYIQVAKANYTTLSKVMIAPGGVWC